MGWTWENANISNQKLKDEAVRDMLECSGDGFSYEVVALSRRGSVYYAAIHYKYEERNIDRIYAEVVLTQVNSNDYWNFGHKEMSESMGPYYYDAPESLLALLTPTNSEWANDWRQKCRERAEARKKERSSVYKIRKLPEGTYIKVDYQEGRLLQVCKYMGKRAYIDWTIRRRMSSNMIARHNWEVVK